MDESRIKGSRADWGMINQQSEIRIEEQEEDDSLQYGRNEEPFHDLNAILQATSKRDEMDGSPMRLTTMP